MPGLPAELDFTTVEGRRATPERMESFATYLHRRFAALESQQPEFKAAVDQLLSLGIDRVNQSLIPIFNQANEISDELAAIQAQWEASDFADTVVAAVLLEVYSQAASDARFAPIAHAHVLDDVTGLVAALAGKAASVHGHAIADVAALQAALDTLTAAAAAKIPSADKGAVNGVASLDAGGKVPAVQLPSYVDDVVEVANYAALPGVGEAGKIYVTIDDGRQWRWSGSAYVEISPSPGSTDAVPEGAANKYFTEGRVRTTLATGLVDTAGTPAAADSFLTILGKVTKALFTDLAATIRGTVATGLADTAGTPAAGDSILTILGKIRKALFTDFNESVDDRVAALLAGAGTVSLSYDDAGNVITITGTDGWTYVRLAAATVIGSNANTTTGLTVPGANFTAGSWEVEALAVIERTVGVQNIVLNLLAPTGTGFGANNWWFPSMPGEGAVTLTNLALGSGSAGDFATLTGLAAGNMRAVLLRGIFSCTAAMTGSLDIRARNGSTTDNQTFEKGSWLRYRKVA